MSSVISDIRWYKCIIIKKSVTIIHSTWLVFMCAREDVTMITSFEAVQSLYVFLSRSTQRWEKLKYPVPVVVNMPETRWSARTEAVKPVTDALDKIIEHNIMESREETSKTGCEEKQLHNRKLS